MPIYRPAKIQNHIMNYLSGQITLDQRREVTPVFDSERADIANRRWKPGQSFKGLKRSKQVGHRLIIRGIDTSLNPFKTMLLKSLSDIAVGFARTHRMMLAHLFNNEIKSNCEHSWAIAQPDLRLLPSLGSREFRPSGRFLFGLLQELRHRSLRREDQFLRWFGAFLPKISPCLDLRLRFQLPRSLWPN